VISWASVRPDFRPAPKEVAALLEIALPDLCDPARLGWSRHSREGIIVDYPHFDLAGHQTWGATAMILGEFGSLSDRLASAEQRFDIDAVVDLRFSCCGHCRSPLRQFHRA